MSTPETAAVSSYGSTNFTDAVTAPTVSVSGGSIYYVPVNQNPVEPYLVKDPNKPVKGLIGAGLFFKYAKKKMSKLRAEQLNNRLEKLRGLRINCAETGQQALLEELEREFVLTAKEQVLLSSNFDKILTRSDIDKYIKRTSDVYLKNLEQFPRAIPSGVRAALRRARELKVFDGFMVLYTDYTGKPVAKSSADRIREKDPILFGVVKLNPDKLYFIADWVDEHCDLTLDKILKTGVETVPVQPLDTLADVVALEKRVEDRLNRLADTRISNWREKEREALRAEVAAEKPTPAESEKPTPPPPPPAPPPSLYTRIKRWFV